MGFGVTTGRLSEGIAAPQMKTDRGQLTRERKQPNTRCRKTKWNGPINPTESIVPGQWRRRDFPCGDISMRFLRLSAVARRGGGNRYGTDRGDTLPKHRSREI